MVTIIRIRVLSILFYPHRASPVRGRTIHFPPLAGGIKGRGIKRPLPLFSI
jgi:hypothetical protein